jgi:hypothetical protein
MKTPSPSTSKVPITIIRKRNLLKKLRIFRLLLIIIYLIFALSSISLYYYYTKIDYTPELFSLTDSIEVSCLNEINDSVEPILYRLSCEETEIHVFLGQLTARNHLKALIEVQSSLNLGTSVPGFTLLSYVLNVNSGYRITPFVISSLNQTIPRTFKIADTNDYNLTFQVDLRSSTSIFNITREETHFIKLNFDLLEEIPDVSIYFSYLIYNIFFYGLIILIPYMLFNHYIGKVNKALKELEVMWEIQSGRTLRH